MLSAQPTVTAPKDHYFDVQGINTHAIEYTSPIDNFKMDSPIVFLHGFGVDSTYLLDVAVSIAIETRLRIILLDLPGMGETDNPPKEGLSMQGLACWLENVLNVLDLREADAFGFSLGARVWIEYLLANPDFSKKVVLISPGGIEVNAENFDSPYEYANLKTRKERTIRKFFYDKDGVYLGNISDIGLRQTMAKVFKRPLFKSADFRDMSSEALIIYGDKDQLIPPQSARVIGQGWPKSTSRVLKDAGHGILSEKPDDIVALASDFFNS